MKRQKVFVAAGLFIAAAVFSVVPVRAQQASSNGFLVSPVREETVLENGKSKTVTLSVKNATNAPTRAQAVVNDFEPSDDESGKPNILLDGSKSKGGNSFMGLVAPIADIELGPQEEKNVKVQITVPMGASAGGYYGAIRFVPVSNGQDNNVALTASVGTIFLITVPGNVTQGLELVEIATAKDEKVGRFYIGSGQMSIVTRLKNTGNVHVKPFGKVQVKDRSGKTVEEYEFNNIEPRSNVLPGSTRKFEDKLQKSYGFGKYTVTANLGYGDGGGLITASNSFWVIPAWVLVALGLVILAVVVAAFIVYRKVSGPAKHKVKARR